jgi:hypothetical protein
MTEQMDHRAAIEAAIRVVENPAGNSLNGVNLARCHLASIKAAWPGRDSEACARDQTGRWISLDTEWQYLANKFERDYPGLKVDDVWLVTVMEGVK